MRRLLLKILSVLIVSFSACMVSDAETVSRKEALKYASAFFNEANGMVMAQPKYVNYGRGLTTDRLFMPFYIFNHPKGGFVIISAENKTFPILAYSLKDRFDEKHIDGPLKALLTSYARDIENIRYDERIPYKAIEAWRDYPSYVASILGASKIVGERAVFIDPDKLKSRIDSITIMEESYRYCSDIFSSSQWQDLVKDVIREKGELTLGLIGKNRVVAVNADGFCGDYIRLNFPSLQDSYFLLNASEIFSEGMIGAFDSPAGAPVVIPENIPFLFYEEFMASSLKEKNDEKQRRERIQYPVDPSVAFLGGGHFNIFIPEKIVSVTVYNLMGSKLGYYKFHDTNNANIDLSIQPAGFYFASAIGESGKKYGFKLVR